MSDERERVTAYVDDRLDGAERALVEARLEEEPELREQVEAERALRARLRELQGPLPRPAFEAQVRAALRAQRRPARARWLLPLAAGLALLVFLRGLPGFVSLEVARDHAKCFSMHPLPAKVWSDDPLEVAAWFEKQGTTLPPLPRAAANLSLVGARYCPLGDRSAPHVYYAGRQGRLSLYMIPGPLRFEGSYATKVRGRNVRFLRSAGVTLALVSEDPATVDAFAKEFAQSLARLQAPPALPPR